MRVKVFDKPFYKKVRSQGRGALVAPRKARNKTSAFLLDRVFFAPPFCKEKPAMDFMLTNSPFVHKEFLADFSFDEIGAKEKSIKKKSAECGGAAPPPRKLLKKLDQNFSNGVTKILSSRYARLLLSRELLTVSSCKRSRLSRDLPVPIATHDTASFATLVLIPVTCVTS